jgi:hypothetical protein
MRTRSATSALIEQNDPVMLGIKITPHRRAAPTARTAMHHNNGLTRRVSTLLNIDLMVLTHIQHLLIERVNRRIQILHCALLVQEFVHY